MDNNNDFKNALKNVIEKLANSISEEDIIKMNLQKLGYDNPSDKEIKLAIDVTDLDRKDKFISRLAQTIKFINGASDLSTDIASHLADLFFDAKKLGMNIQETRQYFKENIEKDRENNNKYWIPKFGCGSDWYNVALHDFRGGYYEWFGASLNNLNLEKEKYIKYLKGGANHV